MPKNKDNEQKINISGSVLDQIKKGVGLQSASSRKLAAKKISEKEQKELDIAEKLEARNKSLRGEDDYDSDTASTSFGSRDTDSDDEYGDIFSKSSASSPSQTKQESKSSSSVDLFKGDRIKNMLSRVSSSSPTQSSGYSSDSEWEDEAKPKSPITQDEIAKETQAKGSRETIESAERKQRVAQSKAELEKSFTKLQTQSTKTQTPKEQTSEDAKSRKRKAQEALEKSFKPKSSTSTISTTSELTPGLTQFAVQLGKYIQPMNYEVKALIEHVGSAKKVISNNSHTEKILRNMEDNLNTGIAKLKDNLAKINKYIESNSLKSEQALKGKLKIFENFAKEAINAIDLAEAEIKQIHETLHSKVQDQEVKIQNLKADSMKVLLQLGDITKSVHESAEEAIRVAQSIATFLSNPKRTESTLNDIKSKTNDAISDLEKLLAKLKDFVQSTTLKSEKALSSGFKTSKAVVDIAEHAIKLAKAELELIRIAIARDQALREAKNAGAVLQKKHMMTEVAKQAAEVARKKFGDNDPNNDKQAKDETLRAAEAEERRAQEESRVKEAEAVRLQEEQHKVQAAVEEEQRKLAEFRKTFG